VKRLFSAFLFVACIHGETGYDAWLRYGRLRDTSIKQYRETVPAAIATFGRSELIDSASGELVRGVLGMLGRTLRVASGPPKENAIVIGTVGELRQFVPDIDAPNLITDSYWLKTVGAGGLHCIVITGPNERGVLYGVFALLRKIALGHDLATLDERQSPYAPIRWINQWDNLDGSIERGYGGRSIFWDHGHVRPDLSRVNDYGRLLASLGINGCSINNVNADPVLLTKEFTPQIARIAAVLRKWGVQTVVSVDLASPKTLGALATFDPLDQRTADWWNVRVDELYAQIPDLAGFVMKADSEGRAGPSAYARTHADAANVVARALKHHGGLLFYRGFVYDHHMDWTNAKNDRARAADDNFRGLDGSFDDNVVIQIKHGPIDFQVREPASPLFGTLEKTNQAIELQITQEYMGQARHMVFLVPMWKEALDFDMHARGAGTPVFALASGKTFHRPTGGFIGVANIGLDESWFGNHMSQANLYGFGRLAWNPRLSAGTIIHEWTRLTFGADPKVDETIDSMQLSSWRTYENYTGPLGLQTLTDIVGNHYGVAVEASERNGWGQWHRADEHSVGMDRTTATGTGYIGQYRPPVAKMYETVDTCPDDLLLFMHHVSYTYKLHSGKSVIQYIYDSHYDGAAAVDQYVAAWKALKAHVDDRRYSEILAQLEYQAGQAQVWRDAVTNWFHRESGIADLKGRVGNYPGRYEAESMNLVGYTVEGVMPWEAASGGKAITCREKQCTASFRYEGPAGWRTLHVQYFDQNNGASRFRLWIGKQPVDEWIADGQFRTSKVDGSSSIRRTVSNFALRPGDEIRIEAIPYGGELAAVDYVEILPTSNQ